MEWRKRFWNQRTIPAIAIHSFLFSDGRYADVAKSAVLWSKLVDGIRTVGGDSVAQPEPVGSVRLRVLPAPEVLGSVV